MKTTRFALFIAVTLFVISLNARASVNWESTLKTSTDGQFAAVSGLFPIADAFSTADNSIITASSNSLSGFIPLPANQDLPQKPVLVPESPTIIAGALLLLPLGVSIFRIVRRGHAA